MSIESQSNTQTNNPEPPDSETFQDPANKPWVWIVLGTLFAAMIPVWPLQGNWWGIPAWAVWAVASSALMSVFAAVVILRVWRDPGNEPGDDDAAG